MASEMVERVAKAAYNALVIIYDAGSPKYEELSKEWQNKLNDIGLKVIQEMREPTEEMINQIVLLNKEMEIWEVESYQRMIDAALKE